METSFVAAVLIAAVLAYDRLGGNYEVSRRLFQVGLAISLTFVVLSATTAFLRTDAAMGGVSFGGDSNSASARDQANQVASAAVVQYAMGVAFLVAGLAALRRYHTLPLGFTLGGVFLLLVGGTTSGVVTLARFSLQSSQKVDVVTFIIALAGTAALLAYGLRLEQEFARDSDDGDDEPQEDIESAG